MKYRLIVIPVAGAILMLVGFLLFGNLNQNLVYYLTPTEAAAQKSSAPAGERFRLGGLVAEGSVVRTDEETRFTLVDDGAAIPVRLTGAPRSSLPRVSGPWLRAAGVPVPSTPTR